MLVKMKAQRKRRPPKKGWLVRQQYRVHKKGGEVIATPVTLAKARKRRPKGGYVTEHTERIVA